MPKLGKVVPTESAMLIRGGHPVRHPKSSFIVGETEEGSIWMVRSIMWEPGETPMLWLVGSDGEHTWVSFDDVVAGIKV